MSTSVVSDDNTPLRDFAGTLVLVGAGKMGSALLHGWLRLGLAPERVVIIDPQPMPDVALLGPRGVRLNPAMNMVGEPAAIVVAVKPQNAAEIMPWLAQTIGRSTVVLSIMAGKTLEFLTETLPPATAIVRSMPNMPAAIGRGITVAVPNAQVTPEQRELAHALLVATGAVEWVEDEALLDPVTALSGSGPAYVFLLAESLAKAGVAAGLPPALAEQLARITVAGSGELLHSSSLDATALRESVTSPGGTTAAALDVLMSPEGLDRLMRDAVTAATKRSRELAG
jgi:pyrroline-5-carboxylate reductase